MFARKSGNPQVEFGHAAEGAGRRFGDQALQALTTLAGMVSGSDERFCAEALASLLRTLEMSHGLIALTGEATRNQLTTVAYIIDGEQAPEFSYSLKGAPCADVMEHDQVFVAAGCRAAYPKCDWLVAEGIEGYVGSVLRTASGEELGVLVIASRRPITKVGGIRGVMSVYAERITGELARRQSTSDLQLLASVFEHSPQGIMITDAEHRIRKVNPAFTRITGWTEQEAIGRRDRMLSAGRDPIDQHEEIRGALDASGIWNGELWSRRRDGEVFPEERTVIAVRDARRQLQHHVSIFSDISGEKFAAERIHRLAHYDATTELPNRVLLQDRLLHAINRATRSGGHLALLFLDLDGFKQINDTLGHAAGDEVLRKVGVRLMSRLRKVDVVARLGGDEFAVVLGDVAAPSDVQGICDQLLAVVTEPYELDGQIGSVTTSIGIAMFPEDGTDVQSLLKHADAAMYQAKAHGKNRYAFYEPEMNRRAEERLQLTQDLRQAFTRNELTLCYQPQYDLASGRLVAVEALTRWQDSKGVMVPPTRFIPLAEDSGLIIELGAWALQEACRQAQLWREQGLDFGRISVNVSGRQFQDEGLQLAVTAALASSGLPAECLELEITEHWVMEGPFRAEKQLRTLSEMGVSLVIDDFGLANSSMAYLKRFPVHKLKIDRSFIRDIPADKEDAAIVSAIIAMGHSLGLRVVAEGVETAEQSSYLRATGCDEAQGYLFGRPVPSDALNVLLLYSPTLSPSRS
ncbi:MAG: EAL domain-containing protein [Gammaproteobacteria bacterium]|nr:EAL domain-containing protein [Gammaproteobacteria bacterium]